MRIKPANQRAFCLPMPFTSETDYAAFDDIERRYLDAPNQFQERLATRVDSVIPRVLQDIRNAPARPKYPIEWQSERQRRAFFATKGFGKGIPYQRTGKLQNSWEVQKNFTPSEGSLDLANNDPKSIYVQGDVVQRMHLASGWPQAVDVVDTYQVTFQKMTVSVWDDVVGSL